CLDKNAKVGARLFLANEFVKRLRADRRLEGVHVLSRTADEPVGHGLFVGLFGDGVKTRLRNDDQALGLSRRMPPRTSMVRMPTASSPATKASIGSPPRSANGK